MSKTIEVLTANCGDCVFTEYGVIEVGNMPCFKHAPGRDESCWPGLGVWPLVHSLQWCGDFKPRKKGAWRFPTEEKEE